MQGGVKGRGEYIEGGGAKEKVAGFSRYTYSLSVRVINETDKVDS